MWMPTRTTPSTAALRLRFCQACREPSCTSVSPAQKSGFSIVDDDPDLSGQNDHIVDRLGTMKSRRFRFHQFDHAWNMPCHFSGGERCIEIGIGVNRIRRKRQGLKQGAAWHWRDAREDRHWIHDSWAKSGRRFRGPKDGRPHTLRGGIFGEPGRRFVGKEVRPAILADECDYPTRSSGLQPGHSATTMLSKPP